MVDRERGDDGVPGPAGERFGEVAGDVARAVGEPFARLVEHRGRAVEQDELSVRMGCQHRSLRSPVPAPRSSTRVIGALAS